MTIDSEPVVIEGPSDPLNPLSGRRPFAEQAGSFTTVQEFEDGYSYEVQVPKGEDLASLIFLLSAVGEGKIINMWDPVDSGDLNDPHFYMQIWVPKGE